MIILPLPPSINGYYSQNKQGRRFKTQEAKDWETLAGYLLLKQEKFGNKKVAILYRFYFKDNRSDYDNRLKILNDLLEKQQIIDNDNQIMQAYIFKIIDKEHQKVEIEIASLSN